VAEFEDQLNSILGNQEAMSQIMALARSLSGEQPQQTASRQEEPACMPVEGESSAPPPDLSALMGQIDPKMLQIGMDVIRQAQSADDRSTALLNALRPFLREERRARLDRAIQITRMTRLIRAALDAFGGKEGERV